jgi:hypothetical protein
MVSKLLPELAMNLNTLSRKLFLFLVIISVAMGCDTPEDPALKNRSVRPADFLSEADYKSLTVEVAYVEGFQPTASTVQNLKAFLGARLNKSTGINIVQRPVPSPGATALNADLLRQLELEYRTENTGGSNITAYIFFSDADYASNNGSSKTLGVAYDYSSMAVFEKAIHEFSGSPGKPTLTTLETTVIFHEFSHILGLVNNGTQMQEQHQDNAHEGHCNNQDCLMYYLAETSGIATTLFGGTVPSLDANCLADLRANGGK